MRTFVKSIVFAVAMLLSVSVWAGNPENAPVSNNVQNAVTIQPANEVKDVQQTPCSVVVYNKCGGGSINVSDTPFGIPCETFAVLFAAYVNSHCNL